MAKEKVLILAVKKASETEQHFKSSLEELHSLSHTAGGEVIHALTQNRPQIHPVTYVGEGKLEETKQFVDADEIELVITNDELSPGQLRNLNDLIGVRVIDRSQLILDIFARRAKTKEGQLQVELAQLQYMLPRLHGMGHVLSRLGGGIGTRGPGETKLESDQRHIRRRIDDIKRQLETVVKQREQYRKRRKLNRVFQIALVGYTNAGKSTIFNQLTNETSLQEDLLFATLDPLTRQIKLPSGFECLLTDTVGFIQDLPTSLIAAFRSTLEEASEADLILHVVDAANEDNVQHQQTVLENLQALGAQTIPTLTIYNKKDIRTEHFYPLHFPNIHISAYNKDDLTELLHKIEATIIAEWKPYHVRLAAHQGKVIDQFRKLTIVKQHYFDEASNEYIFDGYIEKEHPLEQYLKGNTNENEEGNNKSN